MSASMARQGGRVQLEQSDMSIALNMAKMATRGSSCTMIEETQHLIMKPCAAVQEPKKWGVEFPGHRMLKAAMERHPAVVYDNQTDGCLPCHNSQAKNPRTRWRHKGSGALPQVWRKQPTQELTPPPPGTPAAPPGDKHDAQSSQVANLSAVYVYKPTPLPIAQCFNHDLSA